MSDSCVFCQRKAPEVALGGEEHVFPDAIGGRLVLHCVCTSCNSVLGARVDSMLTNNPLIRMIRMALRMQNRDGAVPSLNGRVVGHPEHKALFEPTPDGENRVSVRPLVAGNLVIAPPGEAETILEKKRARAARDGASLKVTQGPSIVLKTPKVTKTEEARSSDIRPPMLKIAYELGIHWLGEAYARHHTGSAMLRALLSGRTPRMTPGYFPRDSAFAAWNIPSYFHAARLHMSGAQAWVTFRVFNVLEGIVLLADQRRDFPGLEDAWLVLDPLRRTFVKGVGAQPPAIAAEPETEITWSLASENKVMVTTTYKGQAPYTVTVERRGVAGTGLVTTLPPTQANLTTRASSSFPSLGVAATKAEASDEGGEDE